jgi:hypothetical protein
VIEGFAEFAWLIRNLKSEPALEAGVSVLDRLVRLFLELAGGERAARNWECVSGSSPRSPPAEPQPVRGERGEDADGAFARHWEPTVASKLKSSHAQNFRRDLEHAFGLQVSKQTAVGRNGEPIGHWEAAEGREMTRRERELFGETEFTLPVDFTSRRRAFSQTLADADVSLQQAQALAGHVSMGAHERYLRNATKTRRLTAAAFRTSELSGLQLS